RPGQAAQECAAESQGDAPRDLPGPESCRGRQGVRPVRADLRGEVPQGDGVPGQGPEGAVDLLRLPGGALAAPADDECHRERVRDGAAADGQDERNGHASRLPDDGLQVDGVGVPEVAGLERLGPLGGGPQRGRVRGWDQAGGRRLTTSSSTTIDNIPCRSDWTVSDSEWASAVLFHSRAALEEVYPRLLRYAITTVSAVDGLRFLGQPVPASG